MTPAKLSRASTAALAALLLATLVTGCAGPSTAGDPGRPVLLTAHTPNATVRREFERQLERDLQTRGITAVPSVTLIPEFSGLGPDAVMTAATQRNAPLILMVRRLVRKHPGEGHAAPTDIARHRTLDDYFASVDRDRRPDLPDPGRQVIEVAGYLRDGDTAELIWSGYSWVDFDGDLEAAIRKTAEIIAVNMADARERIPRAP